MLVLPVHQPYAELIIQGYKRFETRSNSTKIHGKIAIYATKSKIYDSVPFEVKEEGKFMHEYFPDIDFDDMIKGYITGTCYLTEWHKTENLYHKLTPEDWVSGDFTAGRYAWQMEYPKRLPVPIQFKAHQGWNKIDDDIILQAMGEV